MTTGAQTAIQAKIIVEMIAERKRQQTKHGSVRMKLPLYEWNLVLGEEFGEVSKAILDNDIANYRIELIQVAAVAMAALEDLDARVLEVKEAQHALSLRKDSKN